MSVKKKLRPTPATVQAPEHRPAGSPTVGIQVKTTYEIKQIDEDFFDEQ